VDDQTLRFSSDHVWVRLEEDNCAVIGITEEPLKLIQDFNHIRFPDEGMELSKDDNFGTIMQDKKTLFHLVCPLSGEILNVNDDIEDAPDVLLEDNYEEGWLVRLLLHQPEELEDLLTRDEYDVFLSDEDDEYDDDDDAYEEDEDDGDEDDDDEDEFYNNRDDDDY
jgi:glycine cleavage system H protein